MKKLTVSLMAKAKKAAVIILTLMPEKFLTGIYYARIGPYLWTVVSDFWQLFHIKSAFKKT